MHTYNIYIMKLTFRGEDSTMHVLILFLPPPCVLLAILSCMTEHHTTVIVYLKKLKSY